MNSARGRHGTGQKGEGSARSVGEDVTIPPLLPRQLGARRLLQKPVDIRVAQQPVAAHVREMVASIVKLGKEQIPCLVQVCCTGAQECAP